MRKSFMKFITVFDIKVHPASLSEFVTVIREQLQLRKHIVQFGVNSATVNEASENEEFRRVINSADLLNIDGMSVVWALRCLGHTVPERVATPDLADGVMKMAEEQNFSVFLFGATDPVISLCVENLKRKYPLLRINGWRNGYFGPDDEFGIIDQINNSGADILLIGISSPKKEFFYDRFRDKLKVNYVLGVGGYFDILSGRTKRAPKWMQNIGLEWMFRLLQEPNRMWKRYLIGNNKFLLRLIKEKAKGKSDRKHGS